MSLRQVSRPEDIELAEFGGHHNEYRYALRRTWQAHDHTTHNEHVLWVMLNPSTADARVLDPTLRRCAGYTDHWGYTGMLIGNVFAYRATNPKELYKVADPQGIANTWWLDVMAQHAGLVILGWGAQSIVRERRVSGTTFLEDALISIRNGLLVAGKSPTLVHALSHTKDGSPGHPLYLSKGLTPIAYTGPAR